MSLWGEYGGHIFEAPAGGSVNKLKNFNNEDNNGDSLFFSAVAAASFNLAMRKDHYSGFPLNHPTVFFLGGAFSPPDNTS